MSPQGWGLLLVLALLGVNQWVVYNRHMSMCKMTRTAALAYHATDTCQKPDVRSKVEGFHQCDRAKLLSKVKDWECAYLTWWEDTFPVRVYTVMSEYVYTTMVIGVVLATMFIYAAFGAWVADRQNQRQVAFFEAARKELQGLSPPQIQRRRYSDPPQMQLLESALPCNDYCSYAEPKLGYRNRPITVPYIEE